MKNKKMFIIILFTIIVMLLTISCFMTSPVNDKLEDKGKLIIGSKDFPEQIILAKLTMYFLRDQGYNAEGITGMASNVARQALEEGHIDIYWEYTGTGLMIHNKNSKETDSDVAFSRVKELDKEKGLVWLDRANFSNTYILIMRKEDAERNSIKTLSQLSRYVSNNPMDLTFGSNTEFFIREDGMKGLESKYGLIFPPGNVIKMDTGLTYIYLKEKVVDVALGFATDARTKNPDLVILEDDRDYFPPYDAAPVIRKEILDEYPELEELLRELSNRLNHQEITELNYRVDVARENVTVISREWLINNGLIK